MWVPGHIWMRMSITRTTSFICILGLTFHINVSPRTHKYHTYLNDSFICVLGLTFIRGHVILVNGSCHLYEWVVSQIRKGVSICLRFHITNHWLSASTFVCVTWLKRTLGFPNHEPLTQHGWGCPCYPNRNMTWFICVPGLIYMGIHLGFHITNHLLSAAEGARVILTWKWHDSYVTQDSFIRAYTWVSISRTTCSARRRLPALLQHSAKHVSTSLETTPNMLQCVAVCCSVLQFVAVCYSVLQRVRISSMSSTSLSLCLAISTRWWVVVHGSCHAYEKGMSHIWMRHVAHVNESCRSHKRFMSLCLEMTESVWMTHVAHMNASSRSCEWVMSLA